MDKATQRAKIFEYCKKHGSITVRDAFDALSINSPTKRISEMRKMDILSRQSQSAELKTVEKLCGIPGTLLMLRTMKERR